MLPPIEQRLATEIGVSARQVGAAVQLLDDGATVPFIARYRKEATEGLDDIQLRMLEERLGYLRELEERRATVLASIEEQGKLVPALRQDIENAETKQRLEDLYLPYKQKRRTKAQIAREAGLEPLADALVSDPSLDPDTEAAKYLTPAAEPAELQVPDVKAALEGARQILMERYAEDAALLDKLRGYLNEHWLIVSTVVAGKESEGAKFRDWFAFSEPLKSIPSHRALAMLRGRSEGVLRLSLKTAPELADPPQTSPCEAMVAVHLGFADNGRAADRWLLETARWSWMVKLSLHLELELMGQLRERAEAEAIGVFARNLHDLLLAAPAGPRATMGLDPGIHTGVKVAVVDKTGKVLDTAVVHPHEPRRDWDGALHTLAELARKHGVDLVAIGNGTASRETDKLVGDLVKRHPELKLHKVVVSEAGASVYSASEIASREFPDMDVSLRGAVSIARRLQDPLAELVKIDPKSIGVGQYQHDVNQIRLARSLDAVVEDCVNAVGVDVNTASAPLLARISGLNTGLAENIVAHRNAHGTFLSRAQLRDVPRLGDKTFEQAAGFLRINGGDKPKGVVVPVRAIAGFHAYGEFGLGLEPDDVYWCAADPGWAYGLYFGIISSLATGVSSVLMKGGFSAEGTFRTLSLLGVTNFTAAPTVYRSLLSSGVTPPRDLKLRCASSAGEPLTPEVNQWAVKALGVEVADHYGQTEAGMLVNNHHHPDLKRPIKERSMGIGMPGWKPVVLDQEEDVLVAPGTLGRVALELSESPLAWFRGYVNEPGKSAEKFAGNGRWYLTGDLGRLDSEGYIHFSSRADDVIIMAGYRISPFEIESVLLKHPIVAEVAVIAAPDKIRGEVIEAYVVLKKDSGPNPHCERDLQDWVKRTYGAHAYPRAIHLIESLPKTPSGKIQRFILRQARAAELNATAGSTGQT